jgi:hypothetical protein
VGTQTEIDPDLPNTIHVCSTLDEAVQLDPQCLFKNAHVLVIDNALPGVDYELLQSGLRSKERKFKEPFDSGMQKREVLKEVVRLQEAADSLFEKLYPDFNVTYSNGSFRPMVTKSSIAEPMHFDTRPAAPNIPFVTAFINVSVNPRIYRIGPNLVQLVAMYPRLMRKLWLLSGCGDISIRLRALTRDNLPPLNSDTPAHTVHFATGAIWFFDAKTVSHEVIYGDGAVARAWCVPECGAPQQVQILEKMC